jgi:hypothetical protein
MYFDVVFIPAFVIRLQTHENNNTNKIKEIISNTTLSIIKPSGVKMIHVCFSVKGNCNVPVTITRREQVNYKTFVKITKLKTSIGVVKITKYKHNKNKPCILYSFSKKASTVRHLNIKACVIDVLVVFEYQDCNLPEFAVFSSYLTNLGGSSF